MIKKYCDICGKETKENFQKKFESRNETASFYLFGDFFDMEESEQHCVICKRCASESFAKKIDKIEERYGEMIEEFSFKLWLKLRGIKKVPPLPKNPNVFCAICHKELIPKKDKIWGISNVAFLDYEKDCLCSDCQKFEEEVSWKYMEVKRFGDFFRRELKKLGESE
jgi:hypothetical protein